MLFDRLILLNKGELVYQGVNKDIMGYFKSIGHDLDIKSNPADAFIHKIESLNNKKSTALMDSYKKESEIDLINEIDVMINEKKKWRIIIEKLRK